MRNRIHLDSKENQNKEKTTEKAIKFSTVLVLK